MIPAYFLGPGRDNMSDDKAQKSPKYTCNDYRMEMSLLGMRRQIANRELSDSEREKLQTEIDQLEKELGLS